MATDNLSESQRLQALYNLCVLDTEPEPSFDRITWIAAEVDRRTRELPVVPPRPAGGGGARPCDHRRQILHHKNAKTCPAVFRDCLALVRQKLQNDRRRGQGQTETENEGTVKAQTAAIYRKAGVSGRPQLLSLFIDDLMAPPGDAPAARPAP